MVGVKVPSLAVPVAPHALDDGWEPTLHGVGPASTLPPARSKQDSLEISAEALLGELAAKSDEAKRNGERADRLALELQAAKDSPRASLPPTSAIRRSERHAAWLKVAGAIVAILGAGTTYLSIRANSVIEPKVEVTAVKQTQAQIMTDADHDTQLRILEYLRADQARRECLDAQMASAIVRGTGHRISGAGDSVAWIESQLPARRPVAIWERAVFYPATPCAAELKAP